MKAVVGGFSLAAVVVLGLQGAAVAREARSMAHGAKGYPKGFHQPTFTPAARVSGKAEPFMWPVSDRYRPVSKPFYGRAY